MNLVDAGMRKLPFEPLNRQISLSSKTLINEDPKLELKFLPPYLKYVYLGDNDTFLVILFARLSDI